MSVTIYGASDDLIEVEGDSFDAEFSPSGDAAYLAFSDGTVLDIRYTGFWRIALLVAGSAEFSVPQGTDLDTDYSDRAVLTGDVRWVMCGAGFAKASA